MATENDDNKSTPNVSQLEHQSSLDIPDSISKRYAFILQKLIDKDFPLNLEYMLDLISGLAFENDSRQMLGNLVENCEEMFNFMVDRISINDFNIIRKLGSGAFGVVYLVMEKSSHTYMAIKRSEKENIDPTDQSFIIEKKIMLKANSPWMPSCYFCFHNHRYIYYAMELFAGGTIEDMVEAYFPVSEDSCQNIAAQMIQGTNATHKLGYIHRDIKPENFLVTSEGIIKIADFGLARPLDSNWEWYSRVHAGTPSYMSPELFESIKNQTSRNFTTATDYWSVGTSLFQIYYGCALYDGDEDNNIDIQAQVLGHDPHNISFNPLDDPEASVFSDYFKEIITGLLLDEDKRFGYHECKNAKFFSTVNFDNLHNKPPVLVPPLNPNLLKENPQDIKEFKNTNKILNEHTLKFSGFTEAKGNIFEQAFKKVYGETPSTSNVDSTRVNELKQELENARSKFAQALDDLQIETESKNRISEELKSVKLVLIKHESASKAFQAKIDVFQSECSELKEEIEELKSQKAAGKETIDKLTEKIKAKENENIEISNKLDSTSMNVDSLKIKINELNASLASIEKEKSSLNEKIAESMRKISTQQSLESSLASLSSSEKHHITKISDLELQILELDGKVANYEKELKEKNELSTKLQNKANENEEEITKTKLELNAVKNKYSEASSDIEDKNEKIKQLKASKDSLNETLLNTNIKLKETKNNIVDLESKLNVKEHLLENHLAEVEDLKDKLSKSLNVSKKVVKYKKQRDESNQKYLITKNTLDSTVDSNTTLLSKVEDIEKDKANMKTQYESKIYDLRNEYSTLQQQHQQLLNFVNNLSKQGLLLDKKNTKNRSKTINSTETRKLENEKKALKNDNQELRNMFEKLKNYMGTELEEKSKLISEYKQKIQAKDQENLLLRHKIKMLGGSIDLEDFERVDTNSEASDISSAKAIQRANTFRNVQEDVSNEQVKKILEPYINAFKVNSKSVYHMDHDVLSTEVWCPQASKYKRTTKVEKNANCNLVFDIKCRTILFVEDGKEPLEYEVSTTVAVITNSEYAKIVPKSHHDKAMLIFFGTGKIVNNDVAVPSNIKRSEPIYNLTHNKSPTKAHLMPGAQNKQHIFSTESVTTPLVKCALCNKYITTMYEKDVIASKCKTCNIYVHKHHEKETNFLKQVGKCVVKDIRKIAVFSTKSERDTWMNMIKAAHYFNLVNFSQSSK